MTTINDLVRVTVNRAQAGATEQDLGRTLYVQNSTLQFADATVETVEAEQSIRSYSDAAGVHADFGADWDVGYAASAYFAQSPRPSTFLVGNFLPNGIPGLVYGKTAKSLSDIKGVTGANSFKIQIGGKLTANIDVTSVADFAAIGTLFTTRINAISGISNAAFKYNSTEKRFELYVPASNNPDMHDFLVNNAALGEALGLVNPTIYNPIGSETYAQSLSRLAATGSFYAVVPAPPIAQGTGSDKTLSEIAAWVDGNQPRMLIADLQNANILTNLETTSKFAQIAATNSQSDFKIFTRAQTYASARAAGIISAINFNVPNGIPNLLYKGIIGLSPDRYTTTEQEELSRKRVNYYIGEGSRTTLREGWASDGWIDSKLWLDWFSNALSVAVFGFLRGSTSRIPITNEGLSAITNVIDGVCARGVANGGLAPGVVSEAMKFDIQQATGNREFDGELSLGYHIWHPLPAAIDQTVRNNRGPIPFVVWGKGSGVINKLDIVVKFEE